jgi:hypothetical protein
MKFKFLASLLAESPQTEERIKRAGWTPVKVEMVRLNRDDDPTEFGDEPALEAQAVLWLDPNENRVYTRNPWDDEVTGRIMRVSDGLAMETRDGTRYKLTGYTPADGSKLMAHAYE